MKKLSTVVLTAIIGAASASAQYALPAGAFYRGWIAGAGNYGKALKGTEIITPSGADLVWTADAPALNGKAAADKVRNAGNSHIGDYVVQYSPADMNKAQTGYCGDGSYELVYQPSLSLPNDFYYQPAGADQATFKPAALGFVIEKPAAAFGVTGLVWTGRIDNLGNEGDSNLQSLNGHVYKLNDDNTPGDEIASCKIGRADIQTLMDEKGYATIPMYFTNGPVNISEKVVVLIDGFWRSVAVTGAAVSSDAKLKNSSNAVYLANGKVGYWKDIRLNGTRDNNWLAPDLYLHSYTVGLIIENNVIVTPEEAAKLNTQFEKTGGVAEIELTPSLDLNKAALECSDDWFTVEFGQRDAATSKQTVKITASEFTEEAPAARAESTGRKGSFTITAPGNTTTFTVEQSKSSGIETVAAETPVTSEYFDLFGRKLNGKPESGLSIRRDTFANGTTKAVKVIVR